MKFTAALILTLSLLAGTEAQEPPPYDNCAPDTFYLPLQGNFEKPGVRNLLTSEHRNILPAVADATGVEDVTTALADLWAGDTIPVTNQTTVRLIYRDRDFPATPANTQETWRREDLWPADRGAVRGSVAFTDLHSKAPADWSVTLNKRSLFFGECGTVEALSACTTPATTETPADTSQDDKIFLPPSNVRGDIARAVFYTQLRYETELGLSLSDCPPFSDTEFGYKSALLEWHMQDPVDQVEKDRNERVCSRWQGNRNIFVDFPDLVQDYYGMPDSVLPNSLQYSECIVETQMPTATPNECSSVGLGDVVPNVFNAEDPDEIVLFALRPVDEAVEALYITDKAWDGSSFVGDEGTVKYTIPPGGIPQRGIFAYGLDFPQDEGGFEDTGPGVFDLGIAGDNLFVYCINADGLPHFIFGMSYGGDWVEPGLAEYGPSESALPDALMDLASVAVSGGPNFRYNGTDTGSAADLVEAVSTSSNWAGSEVRFNIPTSSAMGRSVWMTLAVAAASLAWTVL